MQVPTVGLRSRASSLEERHSNGLERLGLIDLKIILLICLIFRGFLTDIPNNIPENDRGSNCLNSLYGSRAIL